MKKIILLICISLFFLSACSGSITDEESEISDSSSVTSSDNQDIFEGNDNSINVTIASDSSNIDETVTNNVMNESSWEHLSSIYPTVTYDDIKSGIFPDQYVILPVTIESAEYNELMNWMECDAWFFSEQSYYSNSIYFKCDELLDYTPQLLESGDNVDICFYINRDSSFGSDIKGFHKNNELITLASIYDSFKVNYSSLDYDALLSNPDDYYANTFSISGEVLQILDNENGKIIFLLSLSKDKYVRVCYEYKENDFQILKGDNLTVYGTFYKLYSYNSSHTYPNIIAEIVDNTSIVSTEAVKNSRITYKESIQKESTMLSAINGYRFKNSIDDVELKFEEIYLVSNWESIEPHNDSFLIMKVTASSNTPGDSLYDFPYTIVDSNGTEYKSLNHFFNCTYYEDANGDTIDIATEINLGFVWKDEGKISAYNTNIVKGGNGTRYLVFDIPKDVALDPDSYLIFFGTESEMYKNDAPSKNIYFSDYVILK